MALPEEKFNESVWYVLRKIKERSLYADTEKRVPYFVISSLTDLTNTPCSSDEQISILKKLKRDGIVKFINPEINEEGLYPDFYIEIIQPAFDQHYEFHKIFTDGRQTIGERSSTKASVPTYSKNMDNLLLVKDLKPEISTGKLIAYNDGSIRYDGQVIKMRNQLKDLCRLFMRHPNRLLTADDIKEEVVGADRRKLVSFTTISKYVSELRNSLKIYFGEDVILNQKEEGWFFRPLK